MSLFGFLKKKRTTVVQETNNLDFSRRMEEANIRRNILFKGQRTDSEDYGMTMSNPIMTSSVSGSERYLKSLRTLDGKSFTWHRNGSYCLRNLYGVDNVMVDEYQLILDENSFMKIYICPYGHNSSNAPKGLCLSE